MIVDLAAYVGMWPYWENPYCDETGDRLVNLMDQCGIDQSYVVSTMALFYDDDAGNDMALAAAERHQGRIRPVVVVTPYTNRDNERYIGECIARGARMIKLYPGYHGYPLTPKLESLDRIVRCAGENGIPMGIPSRVFMNFGNPVVPIGEIISFVENYPGTTFVAEGFNQMDVLRLAELAGRCDNTYFCTSGLTMYDGYPLMTEKIGSSRMLFGTTAPFQYPQTGLARVANAAIGDMDRENILHAVARNLFELHEA